MMQPHYVELFFGTLLLNILCKGLRPFENDAFEASGGGAKDCNHHARCKRRGELLRAIAFGIAIGGGY